MELGIKKMVVTPINYRQSKILVNISFKEYILRILLKYKIKYFE
jgi:hypothetical protein